MDAAESTPDMFTCDSLGHMKLETGQFLGWLPTLGQELVAAVRGMTQGSERASVLSRTDAGQPASCSRHSRSRQSGPCPDE